MPMVNMNIIQKSIIITAGGVICAAITFNYISRWFKKSKQKCIERNNIIAVDNIKQLSSVLAILKSKYDGFKVLGFDCEWVTEGHRKPVSLLQIATADGYCVLFRLCKLKCIPEDLKKVLEDPNIYKVGVGISTDAQVLENDYNINLKGCLDLRFLVPQYYAGGLADLANNILGVSMKKDFHVRCSNWEADSLSENQITYAAEDAYIAVAIFQELVFPGYWCVSKEKSNPSDITEKIKKVCGEFIDEKFRIKNKINKQENLDTSYKMLNSCSKISVRKSPLYHNCYLEAPDGELLCTCDPKKAKWYVDKDLAAVVSEDPLTVRLKFEPSGRSRGKADEYYKQVRPNACVVCGETQSYLRKSVVPHTYRKHFPKVMKSKTSHDVLLLCRPCHQKSNYEDAKLRNWLANKCSAPIGQGNDVKFFLLPDKKKVDSAANALLRNGEKIPKNRKEELEQIVRDYLNIAEEEPLTTDVLKTVFEIDSKISNECFQSHSDTVVKFYQESSEGLVALEELWRKHFLKTMKPQYLPPLWSVNHNELRLLKRAAENRVDPQDLAIAGLDLQ